MIKKILNVMIKKILNVVLFVFFLFWGVLFLPYVSGWACILAAVLVLPSKKFQAMLDRLFHSHKAKVIIVTLAVIALVCVHCFDLARLMEIADFDYGSLWVMDIAYAFGWIYGSFVH